MLTCKATPRRVASFCSWSKIKIDHQVLISRKVHRLFFEKTFFPGFESGNLNPDSKARVRAIGLISRLIESERPKVSPESKISSILFPQNKLKIQIKKPGSLRVNWSKTPPGDKMRKDRGLFFSAVAWPNNFIFLFLETWEKSWAESKIWARFDSETGEKKTKTMLKFPFYSILGGVRGRRRQSVL